VADDPGPGRRRLHHPAHHPVSRRGDELADRIAVIDRGRKVAEGTPEELKAQVGGSSLRVQLADGVDATAAAALAAEVVRHRPILTPTGTGFSVSLSDANQAADILIALRHNNVDIASAAIERPSLDEVSWPSPVTLAQHPPRNLKRAKHDRHHDPAPASRRPADRTIRASVPIRDIIVQTTAMAWRALIKMRRNPEQLADRDLHAAGAHALFGFMFGAPWRGAWWAICRR